MKLQLSFAKLQAKLRTENELQQRKYNDMLQWKPESVPKGVLEAALRSLESRLLTLFVRCLHMCRTAAPLFRVVLKGCASLRAGWLEGIPRECYSAFDARCTVAEDDRCPCASEGNHAGNAYVVSV